MPTVMELTQPQRFIQSALANVELAHWFVWSHGICVGYWDETDNTHSVCCWWTVLNRAYLFQTESIIDVCVDSHRLAILSSEGFHIWDGQLMVDSHQTPIHQWQKVRIATWGAVGYTNFGYHIWDKSTQSVARLPMGVSKVWGLSHSGGQEVLWSHWGQFFLQSHGSRRVSALEPFKDTMENWIDLRDGWWVAVYEHSLVAWHRTQSILRFDNMEMMDVSVRACQSRVLILLASGQVLEWRPEADPLPKEIAQAEGEFFIGDGIIFNDGELEYLI